MNLKYSKRELARAEEANAKRKAALDEVRARLDEAHAVAEETGTPEAIHREHLARADLDNIVMSHDHRYPDERPCPRWRKRTSYGTQLRGFVVVARAVGFIAMILAIIGLVIAALIFGIRAIVWHVEHSECPKKGAALGVEVKWEDYSVFGWECLANVQGRWVPVDTVHNDTGVWLRGDG